MQKFPNLKFITDSNNDMKVLNGFLETAKFFDLEKDLKKNFYDIYPVLEEIIKSKNTQKQKNQLVKKFIKKIYQRNSKLFSQSVGDIKRQWRKIKNKFLKKTLILFKDHSWPKGKYTAYSTIWGIYPRFLNNKTFCSPCEYKDANFVLFVIMHELLHFIFYDYAVKKYPKIFKKLDTETEIFWDLAEIFNVIILSLPEFKELHKQKKIFFYSEHKKYIPRLKKLWRETKDIDEWLVKGYEYLKRNQKK